MRLHSFQIKNCFGFGDSGKVNVDDPSNLIYILGRNSSGKTALLTAIEALFSEKVPQDFDRFENFDLFEETLGLYAQFTDIAHDLSLDSLTANVAKAQQQTNQGNPAVVASSEFQSLVNEVTTAVAEIYDQALEEMRAAPAVWVRRTGHGDYSISAHQSFDDIPQRLDAMSQKMSAALGKVGGRFEGGTTQLLVGGSMHAFHLLTEQEIENLLFHQFPVAVRFDRRDNLIEDLPRAIQLPHLEVKSAVLGSFLDMLDRNTVRRFLQSNSPDARNQLLKEMQMETTKLCNTINHAAHSLGLPDLLTIQLAERGGLQIAVKTDTKTSDYAHISENTKILFAYFLLLKAGEVNASILLFDEPNNGFHATAQEELLRFLQELAGHNKQVIVSTHSEHLIDVDHLAGVRLMSTDTDGNYLAVRNKWNSSTKRKGDVLALRPVMDAIGLRFGANHLTIHDKLIVTEEPSALHYLRAFSILFGGEGLHIAPANGGKAIVPVLALVVGQGLAFKVVVDTTTHGKTDKQLIQEWGAVPSESIYEIDIPPQFQKGSASGLQEATDSGIEDVFSKADFRKLLTDQGNPPGPEFDGMSNSAYINMKNVGRVPKLGLAMFFSANIGRYTMESFNQETQTNIRNLLDFCANTSWFRM